MVFQSENATVSKKFFKGYNIEIFQRVELRREKHATLNKNKVNAVVPKLNNSVKNKTKKLALKKIKCCYKALRVDLIVSYWYSWCNGVLWVANRWEENKTTATWVSGECKDLAVTTPLCWLHNIQSPTCRQWKWEKLNGWWYRVGFLSRVTEIENCGKVPFYAKKKINHFASIFQQTRYQ